MMMAQAKTMDGVADVPAGAVPVTGNWTREYFWSLRRELWEHRAIFFVPLGASVLLIVGFLIAVVRTGGGIGEVGPTHAIMSLPIDVAALILMGATFIVALFYCLDALYGERRDRSILFWKSLPVSDLTAVLSKMTIPVVVIPLVCFVVTLATQAVLIVIGGVLMRMGTIPVENLGDLPLLRMSGMLLFHLVAMHGLWFAPFYAWLLLASASANRAPLLWAVLPPAGIAIVEKIAFHTSYFLLLLKDRSHGPGFGKPFTMNDMAMHGAGGLNLGQFLLSPGLWGGLFVAGVFLAGAVRLRRYRSPI
jgi:ABC-2 type transport system permease protein